jgi:hypothetical protein
MMRGATIVWAVLAAVAGAGLFLLKYEVQAQTERLADLRKEISDTRESIHVLKAEWSYLNDPARLKEQAERHLHLRPLRPDQISSIDRIPLAPIKTADHPAAADSPDAAKAASTGPTPSQPATESGAPPAPPPAKDAHPTKTAKPVPAKPSPADPAAKATAVAAAATVRPRVAARPPVAEVSAVPTRTDGRDALVIKSPALLQQEMASTRSPP